MSERTPRFLWLEVTKDEFELPVAVADSAAELSEVLGLDAGSVMSSCSRAKRKGYWCKYKKVPYMKGGDEDGS